MQIPDANDLLLSGGRAPEPLKFTQIGVLVGGRVVSKPKGYHVREYDPRNPGSGAPKFDDNGQPVYGVHIDVETPEGIRRLYVDKPRLTTAVRDAMRAVGVQAIELDGMLYAAWTGEEASNGGQPAKTWAAQYTPPGSAAQGARILSSPQQPPTATAAVPGMQPWATSPHNPQGGSQGQWRGPAGAAAPPVHSVPAAPTPAPAFPSTEPPPSWAVPQHEAPSPQVTTPATQAGPPVITQTVAAAMNAAGIPTDAYMVVPG